MRGKDRVINNIVSDVVNVLITPGSSHAFCKYTGAKGKVSCS